MNNIYIFIRLILSIVTSVLAQVFMKIGASHHVYLFKIMSIGVPLYPIVSILFYFFSFVSYYFALKNNELSFVSPVCTGGVFVLVIVCSFFLFNETISFSKMIGILLICAGIFVLSKTQ